ncbi:putative disease resistance protein RGA3 isoform X4 [Sorghum bicolor]|uniref:putative disease resistance protein RGA3 isoform X4 n=1 Tax=Sorghum bicolor TaxID=4558 RepID=UPI000B4265CA|nr:putative disease resistance protein RGA3 isoform X4 [Sorghum bicolor]|eukprot:XP_021308594.1 putative disease resistance protein RGA3 isoform X4 [Sorghum bicolor]
MATVSADIDRLQRRLASDGQRIKLPSSIRTDLSRMTRALYRLQGILTNVEKQPFDGSREPCLSKIKQNIYDVEDILDELENGSFRAQRSSRGWKLAEASDLWSQVAFSFSSNHSVLHCRMMNKMKKIRKSLDHASEDSFIFTLLHHRADADQSDHNVFDENAIIGRNKDKENVRVLLLSNSEQKISIIPIVGLGGLGKTALAQLIFSDQDERYNFDLRVWINLNMSYDFNSIASAIISEVNITEEGTSQVNGGEYNPQILMNCLLEVLNDKRCLIVLDGLWSIDEGQLLHLKRMLQSTQNTKIIVTTCSENVANLMHTVRPYKLDPLSEENCWTIFSQRVFGGGDNSDLTRIGKQIVNKCEGIPGVIHSLGAFMHDNGTSTWNWNDKNEELWKLEKQFPLQINLFSSVKQIYYKMPLALKSCLSYLSMFPKGSNIRMENVITQWAALGILGSTHGSLPVYAQGRKYIQELLSVFFLEAHDKSTDFGINHASASKVFKMHSLVHEFARYVTSHDLFILDGERMRNDNPGNRTSGYALLTRCSDKSKVSRGFLKSVRAICLKDCRGTKLIEKIFSALKHLRVLDLSRCSFLELPSSICQLTHLRYIDISCSAIQSLPDQMSSVQHLEALDLSGTCIQVLPDFVRTFKKLTYLNLQECWELRHLPSKLDDIKSLQHLNLSCCPAAHQLVESISGFQELRFLDISSCTELQTLPESFVRLTNLEDLILSKCTRLKKLPESFGDKLCFLRFLNISYCCELEEVPASLGRLASLEVLILSGCNRIQNLPQSFSDIAFLRMLDLSGCADLHMDLGMLPNNNLENLNVDGCCKVYAMPGWTVNFPKLLPECLQTCDQHVRRLIEHKQACPNHSELEISNELNVLDETGEAMASQSFQHAGDSECTTKKVIEDSSAHTSPKIPLHGTTPTGVQLKSAGSFFGASTIRFSKMSRCFMCTTDLKMNSQGEGEGEHMDMGRLKDGMAVAVKLLHDSKQGRREFLAELTAISGIVHENLITLVGCCCERSHRILVYNYLENKSLADKLLGSSSSTIQLSWRARVKIAIGVARGLAFLHEEIRPSIIHRDIKASHILLDKDFTPKVSGFGLTRLLPPITTSMATRVAGTIGYMAPEYAIRGQVTKKADIFSFGIVLLEIVSGKCNHDSRLPQEDQFLLKRTWRSSEEGNLVEIIDKDLGDDLDVEEACRFLNVGLLCTQNEMARRPNMRNIVKMLTGEKGVSVVKVTRPIMLWSDLLELKT